MPANRAKLGNVVKVAIGEGQVNDLGLRCAAAINMAVRHAALHPSDDETNPHRGDEHSDQAQENAQVPMQPYDIHPHAPQECEAEQ